ncbi:pentapeptide repeat-containing protein [Agromyces sp. Marseille-P2726]|uniref:pentapeptide repeat-containing protein n=1 Tax=Agromyces sp. Marseille-P2726 TaxID=2709132 RepID=UPI001570F5DD|nr:pentapeptide repeat-containing protein [Agromyces sp. Marseille-P2726]
MSAEETNATSGTGKDSRPSAVSEQAQDGTEATAPRTDFSTTDLVSTTSGRANNDESKAKKRRSRLFVDIAIAVGSGIVSGAIVGFMIFAFQYNVEEERMTREQIREDERQAVAIRLENLRFVRALSSDVILDRPFRGLDLRGMELSGLNLAGADLQGADLTQATITATNLVGANLSGANLTDASLTFSDLTGAQLLNVNIEGARFDSVDLSGAWLDVTEIYDEAPAVVSEPAASWEGVDLIGATVGFIDFSNMSYVHGSSISAAEFRGVDLSGVSIDNEPMSDSGGVENVWFCADGTQLPADFDASYVTDDPNRCVEPRNRISAIVDMYLGGLISEQDLLQTPMIEEGMFERFVIG